MNKLKVRHNTTASMVGTFLLANNCFFDAITYDMAKEIFTIKLNKYSIDFEVWDTISVNNHGVLCIKEGLSH